MAEDDVQTTTEEANEETTDAAAATEAEVQAVEFSEQAQEGAGQPGSIDRILDIQVPVTVRLGQTEMSIDAVLGIANGSVIELDRLASDPVDILVRGKLIARGEVVVVDENFGVRITSILEAEERLSSEDS